MTRLSTLRRDRRGATAAEFAIVLPVLALMLFAGLQFGLLFFANAGLQNAVGEGARMATIWPRKSESEIASRITSAEFGLPAAGVSTPAFVYGTAGGQDFVEITLTYTTTLNFLFFRIEGVTLQETRRAYLP